MQSIISIEISKWCPKVFRKNKLSR